MTNYEVILKKLTIEALSKLLVKTKMVDDGYYDMDDNWQPCYEEYYSHPGMDNVSYSTRDEIESECLEWLNQPYDEKEWENLIELISK